MAENFAKLFTVGNGEQLLSYIETIAGIGDDAGVSVHTMSVIDGVQHLETVTFRGKGYGDHARKFLDALDQDEAEAIYQSYVAAEEAR